MNQSLNYSEYSSSNEHNSFNRLRANGVLNSNIFEFADKHGLIELQDGYYGNERYFYEKKNDVIIMYKVKSICGWDNDTTPEFIKICEKNL